MESQIIREHIDRKLKIGKLDSFFLFLVSSIGLLFSGIQIALKLKDSLSYFLYFFPILMIGWFVPLWIGYVRGSILYDSAIERTRGWIYFIYGIPTYFVYTISFQYISLFKETLLYIVIMIMMILIYVIDFSLVNVSFTLAKKILDICNELPWVTQEQIKNPIAYTIGASKYLRIERAISDTIRNSRYLPIFGAMLSLYANNLPNIEAQKGALFLSFFSQESLNLLMNIIVFPFLLFVMGVLCYSAEQNNRFYAREMASKTESKYEKDKNNKLYVTHKKRISLKAIFIEMSFIIIIAFIFYTCSYIIPEISIHDLIILFTYIIFIFASIITMISETKTISLPFEIDKR